MSTGLEQFAISTVRPDRTCDKHWRD